MTSLRSRSSVRWGLSLTCIVCAALVATGCGAGGESSEESELGSPEIPFTSSPVIPAIKQRHKQLLPPVEWHDQIGREFIDWIPDDFELVREQSDVVYGLGGRWLTLVYETGESSVGRDIIFECQAFFRQYGWQKRARPLHKIWMLSDHQELPLIQLRFRRTAFAHQERHWMMRSYVFISEDQRRIVQYCEVGW